VTLRIPALTDEMRASFPAFVDEWTAIGRSTEPLDRDEAIRGIRDAYAAANLAPPMVFFGISPIGGAVMRTILEQHAASAGVWDGVWAGVWAGVWDGVGAGVGAGVRDGVGAGVRDGVRDGVGAGVGAGVWAGVGAGVGAGVRDGVRENWWREVFYGAHDAGWLSFYDWFRRNGLADICAPLDGLTRLGRSAAWTWLHRGFAVVSGRPAALHDERVPGTLWQRRLHNANGPSVVYRDDWKLHHWHGQLVPEWVITGPTVEKIGAEKNTEIRRCAIEALGWPTYLDRLGVTPVSSEPDPGNPGHTLELFDLPDHVQLYDEPVRLLVMRNASLDRDGSLRTYAETVPVTCRRATDAAAWQFEVDPDLYRTLQRAS